MAQPNPVVGGGASGPSILSRASSIAHFPAEDAWARDGLVKLNHMRDVVAVAQCGSLRSAARYLGVPQPNITRSIRELEHELGVALFERRASGIVLTPIGQVFHRRALGIQLEMHRTREEVEQLKGLGTGTVSVGLSTVAHIALLPKVLAQFRQRFPDVLLKLSEGLFPSMEADIQACRIDFYIGPLAEHVQPLEMAVERWFDNEKVVLCRRGHPMRDATSLSELADASWVTTSITLVGEAELAPLFDSLHLPRPHISAQAATAIGMLVAVAGSDLLGMLPQQWLEVVNATSMLEQIAVREAVPAPVICCVRRAGLPLTPAAKHLCDLFRRADESRAHDRGRRWTHGVVESARSRRPRADSVRRLQSTPGPIGDRAPRSPTPLAIWAVPKTCACS